VARVLTGPVVGCLAEQQVQLCPVRVDQCPALDVSQRREQFQQPAAQRSYDTLKLRSHRAVTRDAASFSPQYAATRRTIEEPV